MELRTEQMFSTDRILVLDGAMGTMLQRFGLEAGESNNLTNPDIVTEIHRLYIAAGAEIIETNTFSADYESARAGAVLARIAADEHAGKRILVAGSVGPTGKSLTMGIDASRPDWRPVSFDEMEQSYFEHIRGLQDGGADLLLIETCFDALNAKAAISAWDRLGRKLPVIVSASVSDLGGRLLTGQTLKAFYTAIRHCSPLAFGINCSLGAENMIPLLQDIASFAECPVICYPNAGLPNESGQYDQSPEEMASQIRKIADAGLVNIVGGCCGSTPEHIKAIAEATRGSKARIIPAKTDTLHVSGLEDVNMDVRESNFTNIGERANVAGSRKFARLIASGDYDGALAVAAAQVEDGASVIDINLDDAMLDSNAQMLTFVRRTMNDPSVCKAALMIDSSHFDTIITGLKNAQGKCIVNSISLKEGADAFVSKALAINSLGAAMVVMAFDEEGQATDYSRKINICGRAYKLLTEAGISPENIIFDVNVLTIGTGIESDRRYAVDFIEAVRWIKANLPGALTSGGISNLSFAFRGNNRVREAMHSVFLYHAIKAGLDMAIVNPGMLQLYDEIEPELRLAVENVILDKSDDAARILLELASGISASKDDGTSQSKVSKKLELEEMLVKGVSEGIEEEVMSRYRAEGSASAVIEGPLMQGMQKVGELFAEGKMFLPQVVKSAKVMKIAVDCLQPYLSGDSSCQQKKPLIVMATVKGDVHDIGKNITASVLACNGFETVDLGVMVEKERIVGEAVRLGADMIGVSGLITPSLKQMEDLCRLMSEKGMAIPLFIGGATTSAMHTALKLAPLYPHVYHGADASATAVLAKRYVIDPESFEREEKEKRVALVSKWTEGRKKMDTEAFAEGEFLRAFCPGMADIPVRELPLEEVAPLIDWHTFLAIWGIRKSDYGRPEVRTLLDEAHRKLTKLPCRIMAGVKFVRAGSFHFSEEHTPVKAFLKDDSPLGLFAASVHTEDSDACDCPACTDMTGKVLRLCLADAASKWIQNQISAPDGFRMILPGIGYPSCPDHSMKKEVLALLDGDGRLGISLTESFAMIPEASVCGFIIAHKSAHYF